MALFASFIILLFVCKTMTISGFSKMFMLNKNRSHRFEFVKGTEMVSVTTRTLVESCRSVNILS